MGISIFLYKGCVEKLLNVIQDFLTCIIAGFFLLQPHLPTVQCHLPCNLCVFGSKR